jgi:flavin reductase (DIM6/NTAB) family NADH-FMN oxidoreductase RutF
MMSETFKENHMVTEQQLRESMRYWASGVSIVSSVFEDNSHGMTVSSFTSLSLEPPLVMVALANSTRTYEMVQHSGVFGITLLAQGQQHISNRFAGQHTENKNRFYGLETFTLQTGSPLLTGGIAFLDCKVAAAHPVGANTLFIGEVVASQVSEQAEMLQPLLYFNRGYRKFGE